MPFPTKEFPAPGEQTGMASIVEVTHR
jgi:hypothetical protein